MITSQESTQRRCRIRCCIHLLLLSLLIAISGCVQPDTLQPLPSPEPEPTTHPVDSASAADTTEQTSPAAETLPGLPLFLFEEGEPAWYTVDDDVMGGVSDSNVSRLFVQSGSGDDPTETYRLRFAGTMSLENNGGFSSARSDWMPVNLSGYDGILLRVLGDGNSYRLRIRTTEFGSNISYNALFRTEAEQWRLAYVPFDAMVPTRFGFRMDVGPLDPTTVASFGFMLSDNQPGEFSLQVDWMRAITRADLDSLESNE